MRHTNDILNKIIEQGNKDNDNVDLDIIAEIEKYMDNHIKCTLKLDYNLACRFILLEHNLYDDIKCINYLKYLLSKDILNDDKFKSYLVILLAWIEDGVIERSDFTRKHLDNILLKSTDLYITSMLYYLKAYDFEKYSSSDSDNIIKLLKLSINTDKYAISSYLLLASKYKELGDRNLSIKYLEEGLKNIKRVVSLDDLSKFDFTDIQFFFNSDIKGNITDQTSYKERYYENI